MLQIKKADNEKCKPLTFSCKPSLAKKWDELARKYGYIKSSGEVDKSKFQTYIMEEILKSEGMLD